MLLNTVQVAHTGVCICRSRGSTAGWPLLFEYVGTGTTLAGVYRRLQTFVPEAAIESPDRSGRLGGKLMALAITAIRAPYIRSILAMMLWLETMPWT
jgi:hypothetical protein